MLSELGEAPRFVGVRQVKRAIEAGDVARVFIALDAEASVTEPLKTLCGEKNIPWVSVDTMKQLGQACHISVGAAVAGIRK